jgi:hypothetical protein
MRSANTGVIFNVEQFQVLDAVIGHASIFVMDVFAFMKLSAKMLFHHMAMFVNSFTVHRDQSIFDRIIDTLPFRIAVLRAKPFDAFT